MKADCERYQSFLNAFIDEELPHNDRVGLEEHLKDCPDCRKELKMLMLTLDALHHIPSPSAPEDFLIRLRQRIADEESEFSGGFWQRTSRWLLAHPAMIAAGFVMIFSLAFALGRFSPKRTGITQAFEMEPVKAWEEQGAPVSEVLAKSDQVKKSIFSSKAQRFSPVTPVSYTEAVFPETMNSASKLFLQTPTQLIINLLRNDSYFEGARIYPIQKGVVVQSKDFVYRITISDQNFINALKWIAEKKELPKSIAESQKAFNLEIEKLPNPLK